MTTATTTEIEAVRLRLSAALVTHFEALASINSRSLEDEIALHLERTRNLGEADAIHLSADESAEVRRLLGGAISTGPKLIDMLRRLTGWKIAGKRVMLSPARQEAIYWWIRNSGLPEDKAFEQLVDQAFGLLLKC